MIEMLKDEQGDQRCRQGVFVECRMCNQQDLVVKSESHGNPVEVGKKRG